MTSGTRYGSLPGCCLLLLLVMSSFSPWCVAEDRAVDRASITPSEESAKLWQTLINQADGLGLPTKFLKTMKPGFITLEFDDLHAFAAEYHPDEHRMVLNLTLSFNAAGGVLRSLASLTPRDLGTLYHELFHAYMDYIGALPSALPSPEDAGAVQLLDFARDLQECRYRQVSITPIRQRKSHTETRVLTDHESWEALNETWAVFIGWAIWANLEGQGARLQQGGKPNGTKREGWLKRLKRADRDADLIGYYEPEDAAERGMARKRYLGPSHRITPQEVKILLKQVLEYPKELTRRSAEVMDQHRSSSPGSPACRQ